MSVLLFALLLIPIILVFYLVYQRYTTQRQKRIVNQHLDHIRQHQILLKPEVSHHTYSGRFAGRLLRFSFDKEITIQAQVTADLEADKIWIYPLKYRFTDDKLKALLEKNRAWTGNAEFDQHFYLAGRPRHLANAVIYPAKRVQSQLLNYSNSIVIVNETGVNIRPNLKNASNMTADDWRSLMGLASDIAQYVEAQYEDSMYSGITVDESASPKHASGHT